MQAAPEEEDEEESDDEELDRRQSRERIPSEPNRQISPLEVRFSQMRARCLFRDNRTLQEAIDAIRAEPCGVEGGGESVDGDGKPAVWRLVAPFPPIEVLQWRCKLRDEQTGRPRLDPKTGGELYDREDRWFSLDNRRLYCLQKVAVSLWPAKAVVDVVELPPGPLTSQRQLKKFRTLDRGRSVQVGERGSGEALVRWSWREAVGLEVAESEPEVENCHVQMRRRPRADHRAPKSQNRGSEGNGSWSNGGDGDDAGNWWGFNAMSWTGILAFLLIYVFLRVVAKTLSAVVKYVLQST